MAERKRGLSTGGLANTLEPVGRRLDEAGVRWAVFAGAAATVYGSKRAVTDADILVPGAEAERVAVLFPEGKLLEHRGCTVSVSLPGCDLVAGLHAMDLDDQMAARINRHEVMVLWVPVIPREDNVLLKGLMGRGPAQGKHDWADVEAMLRQAEELDWEYLEWRARSNMSLPESEAVLERLRRLWQGMGQRSAGAVGA